MQEGMQAGIGKRKMQKKKKKKREINSVITINI